MPRRGERKYTTMMLYPAMNKLTQYIPNRYMMVNVVARRARQIAIEAQRHDEPLDEKRVRNVSAYVALAKDANLTDASHVVSFSLGWFGPTPPARAHHE